MLWGGTDHQLRRIQCPVLESAGSDLNSSPCAPIWLHWFLQQYLGCSRYILVLMWWLILCGYATMVFGASCHIFGSCIYLQDTKIQFNCKLNLTSAISNFSKLRHLTSYVSCHNAMAYDNLCSLSTLLNWRSLMLPPCCSPIASMINPFFLSTVLLVLMH